MRRSTRTTMPLRFIQVNESSAEGSLPRSLVALVPNEVLVMANLPSTFQGETSTGIGVMSLYRQEGTTIVELTTSRPYTWAGEGVNEQRKTRESETFVRGVDKMWRGRFLERLRCLAERNCGSLPGN